MEHHKRLIVTVMLGALPLLGCTEASESADNATPAATVEELDSGVNRITLVESSTKRLGIQFVELAEHGGGLAAPYDVVLYDDFGKEWVYVSPEPNVFMRTPIEINRVEGDMVYLASGPEAGTKVVTSGAAELLGIEAGVGQ